MFSFKSRISSAELVSFPFLVIALVIGDYGGKENYVRKINALNVIYLSQVREKGKNDEKKTKQKRTMKRQS